MVLVDNYEFKNLVGAKKRHKETKWFFIILYNSIHVSNVSSVNFYLYDLIKFYKGFFNFV